MVSQIEILSLAALVMLSGFFSASEAALLSVSRFKVRFYANQSRAGSAYLLKVKENPHRMLATLLICNNSVNVGASAIATNIALKMFSSYGVAITTGVMTFLLLVFGEIVPKNFATTYSGKISLAVAPFVYFLGIILKPLVEVFDFITIRIFRLKAQKPRITEDEIRNIVDIAKEEGEIDKEEKEMIHRIFKFDDIDVDEIKVPRTDMAMLKVTSKLSDAHEMIRRKQYSRIPVYEGGRDKIVGIFYFKDSLDDIKKKKLSRPVSELMRPPLFVPETKKIDEMLKIFQKRKQHMAIIVDEHGGVSGLVTIEDILEEIVGEITDETEKAVPEIQKIDRRTFRILGKADIEDVNKKLKTKYKVEEDFDTMSGFILNAIGRIPEEGETVDIAGTKITIQKAEGNGILKVVVRK